MSSALAAPFEVDLSVGARERALALAAMVAAVLGLVASSLPPIIKLCVAIAAGSYLWWHWRAAARRESLRAVFYADGLVALRRGDDPPLPAKLDQAARLLGVPTLTVSQGTEQWSAPLFSDRLSAGQDHRLRLWLAMNPAEEK